MTRWQLLPPCFPDAECGAGKQISRRRDLHNLLSLFRKTGAGEEIRTLDPNLGNIQIQFRYDPLFFSIIL